MALITISDVKTFLKITSTSYDTLLTAIIGKVNKYIDTRVNRNLDLTTYYELYSGNGETNLIIDNYPIVTITRISEDIDIENRTYGDVINQNYLGVDKEAGILEYIDLTWTKGNRNIYIHYSAGYSTYPADLQLIAINLACKKFYDVEEKRQGITSKNIMSENINFDLSDLNRQDLKTISLYRKRPDKNGLIVSAFTEES